MSITFPFFSDSRFVSVWISVSPSLPLSVRAIGCHGSERRLVRGNNPSIVRPDGELEAARGERQVCAFRFQGERESLVGALLRG